MDLLQRAAGSGLQTSFAQETLDEFYGVVLPFATRSGTGGQTRQWNQVLRQLTPL